MAEQIKRYGGFLAFPVALLFVWWLATRKPKKINAQIKNVGYEKVT